jgi:hypothetical protein
MFSPAARAMPRNRYKPDPLETPMSGNAYPCPTANASRALERVRAHAHAHEKV